MVLLDLKRRIYLYNKKSRLSRFYQLMCYLSVSKLFDYYNCKEKDIKQDFSHCFLFCLKIQKGVNWCYNKLAKRCKLLYKQGDIMRRKPLMVWGARQNKLH